MAVVSGRAFDLTGEWATVGVLEDNFLLLFLMSTAPICHSVML